MIEVLEWVLRAQAATDDSAWREHLDVQGVNAFEVLLEPIYLTLLRELRRTRRGFARRLLDRVRLHGHRFKKSSAERSLTPLSARPERCDVLFWPREPTHAPGHESVARALADRGKTSRFLVSEFKTFRLLAARSVPVVFTRAAWPRETADARREGRGRARMILKSLAPKLPPLQTAEGSPDMTEALRRAIATLLPDVHESVASSRAALDAFQPEAIVVGNDLTLEGRSAALVARSRGVPSASLMHGKVSGYPENRLHCVDRFFAYSDRQREELIALGADAGRIYVGGAPYLDARPRQTGVTHPLVQQRFGLAPGAPWVLVATSGAGHSVSPRHHAITIENLMRLSAKIPEVTFLAKLHRKDRPEHYRRAENLIAGSRLRIVPHGTPGLPPTIFDWLQGCRLVLTGASTVSLEAMLMDVPVVTMDYCGELGDRIDVTATAHVTNEAELEQAVRRILSVEPADRVADERARAQLEDAFGPLDGKSAERIARGIVEMTERARHGIPRA